MISEKTAWLGLRLSQAEHDQIQARARAAGMGMSEYVRRKCLSDTRGPVIKTDVVLLQQIYADQRHVGGNLNQIAYALNRGTPPPQLKQELMNAMTEVQRSSQAISEFIAEARSQI